MSLARRTVLSRLLAGTTLMATTGHALAQGPLAATTTTLPGHALVLKLPGVLQPNAFADLSAAVLRTDGTSTTVQCQWSSSNTKLATVSRAGVLATGTVAVDAAVVITATVVYEGATLTASQTVFLAAAAARLMRLEVLGSRSLQSGSQLRLRVVAYYDDLSYRSVKPVSWTLHSDNSEAITFIFAGGLSVDFARGILKLNAIDRQYALDISATYTEGGISVVGRLDLVATAQASTLETLKIITPSGVLSAGDTVALKALGVYADQSLKTVAARWQVDHDAVQIAANGQLMVGSLSQDTTALLTASFAEGGITSTAEFQLQLNKTASAAPIELEVEASGPRSRYGLSAWVRIPAANPAMLSSSVARQTASAGPGFKLYVVALLPGGSALSGVYVLNRSKEWQALSFPLEEYLSGVVDSRDYLVDIFEQIDSRLIAGTAIYIGYGTSDTEMLAQGRYRVLQVL